MLPSNENKYTHSGVVDVDNKRVWVEYCFINEDTIECKTFSGRIFITSYKSLVCE